ncbi:hypothetical protein BN1723_018706, partial [Verticillium longisporum]
LRSLVSRLDSIASISTQGSGILQKLFEITSTIADVLAVSVNQPSMESHIGDFLYIARFLINFERMRDKHRVYLQEKMDTLRGSYPGLPFSPLVNNVLMPRMLGVNSWNWGAKTGLFWAGLV